jgi:starch synthase
MHAQRYGALPIAHATGGLSDTVEDGRTGFLFREFSTEGLRDACGRAFSAFSEHARLEEMRQAAMARDFSWSCAAAHYANLYRNLIEAARSAGEPNGRCAARGHARRRTTRVLPKTLAA